MEKISKGLVDCPAGVTHTPTPDSYEVGLVVRSVWSVAEAVRQTI